MGNAYFARLINPKGCLLRDSFFTGSAGFFSPVPHGHLLGRWPGDSPFMIRSEQRLKEWVFERALERRVSIGTIRRMIASGKLKPEITRRLNARVVFVRKASVNNL